MSAPTTETAELEWLRIYYVKGTAPKGSRHRYEVADPPCSGWQFAVVIPAGKRSTIFCPYTLESYSVRSDCAELATARRDLGPLPEAFVVRTIKEKWAEMQARGWMKDYDTAALVLRRLGAEVPAQVLKGGEEDTRRKGGKEVAVTLEKPVKRASKRGRFLEWFLAGGGSRPVREAMAEFGMTRSNALSYLFMLQKDHGIGYALTGDTAVLTLPEGCTNPFDDAATAPTVEAPTPAPEPEPEQEEEVDDDPDAFLR